jgi:hypothetical protein
MNIIKFVLLNQFKKLKILISFKNKKLKVIYKFICLSIMIYQIINVTLNYISFPFRVNLHLTDDQNKYLPSITVCIPFDMKCLIDEVINGNTFKIKIEKFSTIIPEESIKCEIFYKNNNNKFRKIDCNKISNIISKFILNYQIKCFTYFQKRELLYNSNISDYELIQIEFKFIKRILFISDSCFGVSRHDRNEKYVSHTFLTQNRNCFFYSYHINFK